MEESLLPTTGMIGTATQGIPGTASHDISKRLDTLKALTGFEQLNQMRAQSPTGGALGQVSERELGFLQSVIGLLEQSQSEEQFRENLKRVEDAFSTVVHGPKAGQGGPPAPTGQPQQAPRGDAARIGMYARLDAAGMKRQAAEMQSNPDRYSDAERRAAGLRWRALFGE